MKKEIRSLISKYRKKAKQHYRTSEQLRKDTQSDEAFHDMIVTSSHADALTGVANELSKLLANQPKKVVKR